MNYLLAKRIVHRIWISIALLIILGACLLSIARLLLPMSNRYQVRIETWATKQFHTSVKIADIEALWQGFEPTIKLKQVIVGETGGRVPPFRVEELYVGIDLFRSLLKRQFILGRLKLAGVDLKLQIDNQGRLGIQDFSSPQTSSELAFVQPDQALHWLLQQRQLIFSGVSVDVANPDGTSLHIHDLGLNVENHQRRHQLNATAKISNSPDTQLALVVKLLGSANQMDALRGKFYLTAKNINFFTGSKYLPGLGETIKGGNGKVELWGRIREGQIHKVQSKLSVKNVILKNKQVSTIVNSLSGFVRWKHIKTGGWLLSSKKIMMVLNGQRQPDNAFRLLVGDKDYTTRQKFDFYIKQFKLQEIIPLFKDSPLFSEKIQKQLSQASIFGIVRQLNMSLQRYEGHISALSLGAYVDNLTVNGLDKVPAISGLSGYLKTDRKQGHFDIYSQRVLVKFKKLFRGALNFSRLQGQVHWYFDNGGWHIVAPNIHAENPLAQGRANVALTVPADGSDIDVELLAHLYGNAFDNGLLKPHIPVGILSAPVVKWLDESIQRGGPSETRLILRGPLHHFPFDDNSGTFIVDSAIDDLDLAYYPRWPEAKGLGGNIHFEGRSLVAHANQGSVSGAVINNVVATIPYMGRHKPVTLSLRGKGKGDMHNGQDFIVHSPLETLFGEVFNDIVLSGPTHLDLGLQIPIHPHGIPKVNGTMTAKDGVFHYPRVGLNAKDVTGELHFTEKAVNSHHLKATLFSQPVTVDIHSQPTQLHIDVAGKVAAQRLLNHYHVHLGDLLDGIIQYSANLQLSHETKNTLLIKSDLVGLTSDFPLPFSKQAQQARPTEVNATFDNKSLAVNFNHADFAKGLLEFVNEKEGLGFSDGHITINGAQPVSQKLSGLLVDGDLNQFHAEDWIDTIVKLKSEPQGDNSGFSIDAILRKIRLKTKQIDFMGYFYHDVLMTISPQLQAWQIQLKSEKLDGSILLPKGFPDQPLAAEFNHLYLPYKVQQDSSGAVAFENMPAIRFFAKDLHTETRALGQVNVITEKNRDSYLFKDIFIENNAYQIHAEGRWEKDKTLFSGRLQSDNIAHVLEAWDLPDNIHSKDTNIDFTLHWLDGPTEFAWDKLNGDFSIHLTNGYVEGLGKDTDAKIGLGRIVTLFSLQSLSKRLQMDFRDLTHKGFYFDKLTGDFLLKNGNAKTNNLNLDGTVAHVDLSGRVGVPDQDYDLTLSVMPHLTSSLPLMATIAGGPIAGIATWLVDKAVSPEVKKMTRHVYQITGHWADPDIQQVE